MQKNKLQNITFSAESDMIALARARAKASKTTLNIEFRNWLLQFSRSTKSKKWYMEFMKEFESVDSGKTFRREDFYEE